MRELYLAEKRTSYPAIRFDGGLESAHAAIRWIAKLNSRVSAYWTTDADDDTKGYLVIVKPGGSWEQQVRPGRWIVYHARHDSGFPITIVPDEDLSEYYDIESEVTE